jgi:hypothetical protein
MMEENKIGAKSLLYRGYLEERFHEEGNPVYAWEAYTICREEGIPVDSFVLGYLDRVAMQMMALLEEAKGTKKTSDRRTRDKVYDALGMKKRGPWNVFQRYHTAEINKEGLSRVLQGLREDNLDLVVKRIAKEMEVSRSQVYKWYYSGYNK